MPKTIIKVYFNNGCTTLAFTQNTTAEDIIKVVIKGRLSLNELRYKKCFALRATKFLHPLKDFDPSSDSNENSKSEINAQNYKIIDHFWLRNASTIKEWLDFINAQACENNENPTDYWKLHLRVRYLPGDLNEVKFKDPITFNYYYEQVKNDFYRDIAPEIDDSDTYVVPVLLELGCLEMRRLYQNMNPNVLDKKINYEYLEKEIGLKRFFPNIVLRQKPKNIKKMIIKGLKVYENLKELECMIKYLEKLLSIWSYDEEVFKCHLGNAWGVPVFVTISYISGISCKMENSNEVFKSTEFEKIVQIMTELDDNKNDGLLKFKMVDTKDFLVFRFDSIRKAEDMASLVDGCCSRFNNNVPTIWLRLDVDDQSAETNRKSYDRLSEKFGMLGNKSLQKSNSVHRLDETTGGSTSISSVDINNSDDLVAYDLNKFNQIPLENVLIHEKLGSGQFGDVFRATYKKKNGIMVEVAIKKLKINEFGNQLNSNEQQLITQRFMCEAKIMQNFDHPHIIKLIGILIPETFGIVMEFAKFGQLQSYLQSHKDQIEMETLLLYCLQLNSAMVYLECKNYVHRDIAARNILVANHECVKLADFGLSKEIDENLLTSKCKMPIKWMAPESINFGKYTSKSDVWMFGICVWEIFSYGAKPFAGIKNSEVKKLIEDKYRLEKPVICPYELYLLMLECWEYDGSRRPSFSQLKEFISSIYSNYSDKKPPIMAKSLSNGSSFQSNSSISSTRSSSTNINEIPNTVTIMKMMPLTRQLSQTKMESTGSPQNDGMPPAKPLRTNNNFSPENNIYRNNYRFQTNLPPTVANKFEATERYDNRNNPNNNGDLSYKNEAIIINRKDLIENAILTNFAKSNMDNWNDNVDENNLEEWSTPSGLSSSQQSKDENVRYSNNIMTTTQTPSETFSTTLNDSKWLEESFLKMGLNKQASNRSSSASQSSNRSFQTFNHAQNQETIDLNRKDLILRDKTLDFIQKISILMKCLNSKDNLKLENKLGDVVSSLKCLIETVEAVRMHIVNENRSKRLINQIEELENSLNLLIVELRLNKIERVVSLGLEMARSANEMFLGLTQS